MTLDAFALLMALGFVATGVLALFLLALMLVVIRPEAKKKGAKR